MSTTITVRKITISLPGELVAFADACAAETHTSRSQIISQMLAEAKARTEAQLAAQGYQFYRQELAEFAEVSGSAVAESWPMETWVDRQPEGIHYVR